MIYRESSQKIVADTEAVSKALQNIPDFSKNLVGARLTYTLNTKGKISELQGVEEYVARMMGTPEGQSEEQRKMNGIMREALTKTLSQESLESMFEKAFGTLPDAPIAPGQSWKTKAEMPAVMGLEIGETGTRTFVRREGGLVVLSENSAIASDPGKPQNIPLPANPNSKTKGPAPTAKMVMESTARGETKVDEKTGMVRSRRSSQKTRTQTTIENIDGKGGKMEMTMEMTDQSNSTTELLPITPETETKVTP